jgi:hypothetical protein
LKKDSRSVSEQEELATLVDVFEPQQNDNLLKNSGCIVVGQRLMGIRIANKGEIVYWS